MTRILIVDDSQMTRNFHTYVLRSAGFDVIDASDGAEALEILYREGNIDCIITDLNMPNVDGFTMIKRIREDPVFTDLPIIIVSTLDEIKDKEKGFTIGANFYIIKPIVPQVLVEHVRIAVGGNKG
ncbi:MAG: response regulator [Thermotoga sp.]|nr:MAG: response regulator [Thermotoga sp.]